MIGVNGALLGKERVPSTTAASGLWKLNEQILAKRDAIWPDARDPFFSSVSLLLHGDGTNGSTTITDNSPSPKTVTAFGNAQISTAQSKFGGASIAFDGNGDYLRATDASAFGLGTDNWTVEFWVRLNTVSVGYQNIVDFRSNSNISSTVPVISVNNAVLEYYVTPASRITYNGLSANVWYHIAVCKSSGYTSMFVDGTRVGSTYVDSVNYFNNGEVRIGAQPTSPSGNTTFFNGYLDELRITKGIARYSFNFTPVVAPFPNF